MENIKKFVKKHPFLCISTFGLAILGFMGARSVRWIIQKCKRTKKVDDVATDIFQKEHESRIDPINNSSIQKTPGEPIQKEPTPERPSNKILDPFMNRVKDLTIPEGKITKGYGEYLVFHKAPDGKAVKPNEETYEKAYQVLNDYAPAAIVDSGEANPVEICQNRVQIIKDKLKEIDPTLEAVFIPKTLYELIFLRKIISEDLKQNNLCDGTIRKFHRCPKWRAEFKDDMIKRKCWHLCIFDNAGDNDDPKLKEVAYRLNKAALKTLSPTSEGFTHREILQNADREINFLREHYKTGEQEIEKLRRGEEIKSIFQYYGESHTPTMNFGCEIERNPHVPMGIRNDQDADIIRNAISLECSEVAQNAFLLYRGAKFKEDTPFSKSNSNIPYSLSYGSSLFAGCIFDGGATAYKFMRDDKNDAFAIPVPFNELHTSPFYIPPTNTLAQMFGYGEIFHGRTKAGKGQEFSSLSSGINLCTRSKKVNHLKSNLSPEELVKQFWEYRNQAINLKG